MNQDLQRFRELLPFFANGTLKEVDKAFVAAYLAQHPEAHAEADFTQALRAAVKAVGSERSEEAGLDRLLNNIRQNRRQNKPPLWIRWQLTCRDWGLTPAFAMMSAIAVIQSFALLDLWRQNQTASSLSAYRSIPEASAQAAIKLIISPGANFGDLVMLLRQTGCRIVNGPSESGELWLALDDKTRLKEVSKLLQSSPGVIDLLIIEATRK
jgi:hypothetical protein